MIETSPQFRMGYQCAIDDLKVIFENAKIFNPSMDIIGLLEDWEKITAMTQKKLLCKKDN